ncbi:hypothetical protein CB1_001440002 [Camelus ferus]|nr:hypothetical protein CB1_001440002 [Camelus ferus]
MKGKQSKQMKLSIFLIRKFNIAHVVHVPYSRKYALLYIHMDTSYPSFTSHSLLPKWTLSTAYLRIGFILQREGLKVECGRLKGDAVPNLASSRLPLELGRTDMQSRSSSKSSWSVPTFKLCNKSDWHCPDPFLTTIPCWKVATLASSCSRSRKDSYLDVTHLENRTGSWLWDGFHQIQRLGFSEPEPEVSSASYVALMAEAALSKGPWCQQLLVRGALDQFRHGRHQWHQVRVFHQNVFPNFTVVIVEKPPCFLRKFSPNGLYFTAFSSDQTSLEIYEHQGCQAAEDLLQGYEGEILSGGNDLRSVNIRGQLFVF